eukprot:scaffold145457_cov90-Attheya_sp.AAC.2
MEKTDGGNSYRGTTSHNGFNKLQEKHGSIRESALDDEQEDILVQDCHHLLNSTITLLEEWPAKTANHMTQWLASNIWHHHSSSTAYSHSQTPRSTKLSSFHNKQTTVAVAPPSQKKHQKL